jgi:hypothetical protein
MDTSTQLSKITNLIAFPQDYNKPFPNHLKTFATTGTIFAMLGGYSAYLWGSKPIYGILFGYAMIVGYNNRYIKEYLN